MDRSPKSTADVARKEQAEADRGYPYDEDEVNAKQVARVLKLVKAHEASTGAGEPREARRANGVTEGWKM